MPINFALVQMHLAIKSPRTFIAISNDLIEADVQLSVSAKRLVYLYLTEIKPNVKHKKIEIARGDFITIDRKFTISHHKYAERLEISTSNAWKELRSIAEELFHAEIVLEKNGIIEMFRWFSYLKLDESNKTITASWSEEIIPYISQLNDHYTALNFGDFSKLSSIYSQKLYEMLKYKNSFGNWWKIPVKSLYYKLNVPESRRNYGQFKGKILKPALAELKAKLFWNIEVKEFKIGKEVDEIWLRKV